MQNYKIILPGNFFLTLLIILVLFFAKGYSRIPVSNSPKKSDVFFNREFLNTRMNTPIDKKYLLGKFNPAKESAFIEADLKYANRKGVYLRKETYDAFKRMHKAALKDGIELTIISATRSFDTQKYIWEGKWNGKKLVNGKNLAQTVNNPFERAKIILKFSSMPGTSRHHWGTDIDLNKEKKDYFLTEKGEKVYKWLKKNALIFGFCQPYTPKDPSRPSGHEEEEWHWSYIPLAKSFLTQYQNKISYDDLKGFMGWETAKKLNVIENYVLAINSDCK